MPDPEKIKSKSTVFYKGIKYEGENNQYGDSYNSNSYVSGILNAADVFVPPLDKGMDMPGYNKPLPEKYFTEKATK